MNASAYLAISCGIYMVISFITNRGFIIAPRYRALLAHADECRARAVLMASRITDQRAPAILAENTAQLDKVAPATGRRGVRSLPRKVFLSPLTEIAALQITLNAITRRMVFLVSDDDLPAYAGAVLSDRASSAAASAFDGKLAAMPSGDARRFTITEALAVRDAAAERQLMAQFDRERVAMWLAVVGLFVVFAIGFFEGHEIPLLMGALGGFLAPVVSTLTRARNSAFWGVMVLSPVGGALTAIGGLLLVELLAAAGVLGQSIFAQVWDASTTPVALALALLFGFSGRLFSQLAIAASSQLSTPPTTASPTTTGDASP